MKVYYIIPLNYQFTGDIQRISESSYIIIQERLSLRYNNPEVTVSVSYMFLPK